MKSKTHLILCICCIFIINSNTIYAQNAKQYYKNALEFKKQKKYEESISELNKSIALDSNNIRTFIERASLYENLGKCENAIHDYRKIIQFDNKNDEAMNSLGNCLIKFEKYNEAIEIYTKLLQLKPRLIPVYENLMLAKINIKDFNGAISTCSTAIGYADNYDMLYYFRGVCNDSLSDYSRALTDYTKAITLMMKKEENKSKIQVQYKKYFINAGLSQIKLAQYNEAIKNYTIAINIDKNDYYPYMLRGMAYILLLNTQEAMNDLNSSILLDKTQPEVFYQRASLYKKIGQYQNAIADLTLAITLNNKKYEFYLVRAQCNVEISKFDDAINDINQSLALNPNDKSIISYSQKIDKLQYDRNKETNPPIIILTSLEANYNNIVNIRHDLKTVEIQGEISDQSKIKSIIVNALDAKYNKNVLNPKFSVKIPLENVDTLHIVATDIYNNIALLNYKIRRTETNPPIVTLTSPFPTMEKEIYIDNPKNKNIYIEGKANDESVIQSITINGINASFLPNSTSTQFTANVNIIGKDSITINATDIYGNLAVIKYKLLRDDSLGTNPMGRTWVVFIENSNYKNLQTLNGPSADRIVLNSALANYKIDKILIKKDCTKADLDRFFSIELRDLINKNRINSVLIWYAGHGKFLNETGYWIPVDANKDDEYTYYSVSNLKASLQAYSSVKHVLVVSDACESGPGFYMAMRDEIKPRTCADWEATKFKSAQVFTSSNKELSSDNSQFTKTFANVLTNNPDDCISVENIVLKVTQSVKQNSNQTPRFGKIKGLDDEQGTFFFIKRK